MIFTTTRVYCTGFTSGYLLCSGSDSAWYYLKVASLQQLKLQHYWENIFGWRGYSTAHHWFTSLPICACYNHNFCETNFSLPFVATHCAASRGHQRTLETLVKKGCRVDSTDKNGCTPLFYSVTLNNMGTTKTLLNKKADPNHQDTRLRRCAELGAVSLV